MILRKPTPHSRRTMTRSTAVCGATWINSKLSTRAPAPTELPATILRRRKTAMSIVAPEKRTTASARLRSVFLTGPRLTGSRKFLEKTMNELSPQLIDTLLKLLLIHAIEGAPPDVQKMLHGENPLPINDPRIVAALQRHQFAKHKKLVDAARGGKQPAPTAPKNQPSGGKQRPFGRDT